MRGCRKLIDRLKLRSIRKELEEIVEMKMREHGIKDGSGYKLLMGLVMAEVRGRIDGAVVNEVVRKKLGMYNSYVYYYCIAKNRKSLKLVWI